MKLIAFTNSEGLLSIVTPVRERLGVETEEDFLFDIARRAVPAGVPWIAVEASDVEKLDRGDRGGWRVDLKTGKLSTDKAKAASFRERLASQAKARLSSVLGG